MYEKYQDYRRAWENAYRIDPPVPLNLDLELASVCNLACPFCFISDKKFDTHIRQLGDDGKQKRRFMAVEMALSVLQQAALLGVPAVKFNWRGESTLHPHFSHIIRSARNGYYSRYFMELLVNTNANCKSQALDGLMAASKVMVSLDSTHRETYEKMRVGGDLTRAILVIRELVRREHRNIWVRRVVTDENRHENFFDECRLLFGDRVKLSEHACFNRNGGLVDENECVHTLRRTYCGYPSQRLVISSEGLCYPCCIDLHEEMPVGDIRKQSIEEIWNGKKLMDLRAQLRSNEFKSRACENCQSWMAYDHLNRLFVQDREEIKIK